MEYLIGLILSLVVAGFAIIVGFNRDRSFYPTVFIIIASYYVLFAVMGASRRTLVIEIFAASGFLIFAVLGFKRNLWLAVAAMVGHGCFDFVHHLFVENPGVPRWWPGFCLAFDVIFWRIIGHASDEAIYTFAQPGPAHTLAQGRHLSSLPLVVPLAGKKWRERRDSNPRPPA